MVVDAFLPKPSQNFFFLLSIDFPIDRRATNQKEEEGRRVQQLHISPSETLLGSSLPLSGFPYDSAVLGCPKGVIRVSVEGDLQEGKDEIGRGNVIPLYTMINFTEKKF